MPQPVLLPASGPGTDLVSFFAEHLQALQPALDCSVTEYDELVQITELRITSVVESPSAVEVHYVVSWQAFHACDDQTVAGRVARVVRGRRGGLNWSFERNSPPPARDTVDEF